MSSIFYYEQISLSRLPQGTYYIKVDGYSSSQNSYKLVVRVHSNSNNPNVPAEPDQPIDTNDYPPVTPTPTQPPALENDRFEPNNNKEQATQLTTGLYDNLTLNNTADWYQVTVKENGSLRVQIEFNNQLGDLDISIHHSNGRVQKAESQKNVEYLWANYLPAGTYYIQVKGYQAEQNRYAMKLEVSDFSFGSPEYSVDNDDD